MHVVVWKIPGVFQILLVIVIVMMVMNDFRTRMIIKLMITYDICKMNCTLVVLKAQIYAENSKSVVFAYFFSPFTDNFFSEKGYTDLKGAPPH